MRQRYINTDIVLESRNDLSPLAEIFEQNADLLYAQRFPNGVWHISAEARGSGIVGDPDCTLERDIDALLHLLESLNKEQKRLLETCERFDLDIGWASSDQRPEGQIRVHPKVLSRIAALGATLIVTVYPSSENDYRENEATG